jgi:two-component system cell cycle sensor histidine kinase/response regulator CckA
MENKAMLGISTGTETILVIENEPEMRRLISQMLGLAGYTVWEAADDAEAVRLMEEGGRPADLLLADVAIPAGSGGTLTQRLAQQYPATRILFTSEHPDGEVVREVAAAGAQVLPKPFSPGALMYKIREVLDEPPEYLSSQSAAAGGDHSRVI